MIQCQVKLKLRPAQERQLERWLWNLTGVWNWAIRKIEQDAKGCIYYSAWDLEAKAKGHWRKLGIPQMAITGTIRTAHGAWQRCFEKLSGRPKLKSRRNRLNSILFTHHYNQRLDDGRVRLPGIGPVRFHRQDIPAGRIGQVRLVKRASGWYACLFIQAERQAIVSSGTEAVGIDPGFSHLVTLSTGEKVERPHELRAGAERLAQAQRGRRLKLTARLLERQANRRKDRNHKLSLRLVQQHAAIAWSADASRNISRTFGKSVASAGHYQLRQFLEYKSRSGGIRFVAVNSRRSTRTCSACRSLSGPTGWRGLSVRQWVCEHCGCEHDRDVNAAINTLIAGLGTSHERSREAASGIANG